jgi:hypothetical protein
MGIAITRARIETLFPGRASLELSAAAGGGTLVTVCLPWLEGTEAAA